MDDDAPLEDRAVTFEQAQEQLCERVVRWYGVAREEIVVVFAPYRICPLGAHIDHQLGRVTAMALDRGVLLAFAPRAAREVQLRSLDFAGEVHVRFDSVAEPQAGDWGNYVRGAVRAMQNRFELRHGLVGATAGRVAEGGLSSSAAVGLAYLFALQHVNRLHVSPEENVALVQAIENDYLGLRIGILDQSAILFSRRHALTLINCADVTHELIECPDTMQQFSILIAFSGLRKSLVGTDYNQRVAECARAAQVLLRAAGRPEAPARLGNVTQLEYEQYADRLTDAPALRAAHFFSEMERVRRGTKAWRRGDLLEFGRLVSQSGASSIHNYECGAPPLIDLYHTLIDAEGVYGARFSGAGFRGCCLALVDPLNAEQIARSVHQAYLRRHPELAERAWTMLCQRGDNVRFV